MKRLFTPALFVLNILLLLAFSGPRLSAESQTEGLTNCCIEDYCCINCCVLVNDCLMPGPCE